VLQEVLHVLRERGWKVEQFASRVPAERLAALVSPAAAKELPGPLAKQVLGWMLEEQGDVAELLDRHGVRPRERAEELRPLVIEVLEEHPEAVAQYLEGRSRTFDFLVGQVMKKSGGQAAPARVRELLEAELAGRGGLAGPGAAP
jgi:aspartyl-tRNA(Asn)/glutamyl-tRNA(Gln) amidotransferase subunit B